MNSFLKGNMLSSTRIFCLKGIKCLKDMLKRMRPTANTRTSTLKMYIIQQKLSSFFHPICACLIILFTICGFIWITYLYKKETIETFSKDPHHLDPTRLFQTSMTENVNVKIINTLERQEGEDRQYNSSEIHYTSKTNGYSADSFTRQTNADVRMAKRPEVINIGIQKCGTGALNAYLNIHPNLKVMKTEVHFFDKLINHKRPFKEELKRYIKMLPRAFPNETIFEKTPAYFDLADPYDLHRMNPALKLILLVCDPVRRAVSAYVHNKAHGRYSKDKSYEDIIFDKDGYINTTEEVIIRSRYDKPLERYLKYFPRSQFLIMENTFLMSQPTLAMQEIEKFLGLKKFYTNETFYFHKSVGYYCINPSIQRDNAGCLGRNKYRFHPYVSEENILKLKHFFQPINDNFMKLAGKKFPSLMYF
ncbi:unnamed protein product [Owenia fusiformis]|uniref:Sulfotransferase domain-containing protein n=1 Tax=Owenia fusiformis TaxID=6347 RepID=A0A8S4Q3W9_OWEFU|nr:unnamed protein product [Owenia fusiformis]